jgi:hypothetical protein
VQIFPISDRTEGFTNVVIKNNRLVWATGFEPRGLVIRRVDSGRLNLRDPSDCIQDRTDHGVNMLSAQKLSLSSDIKGRLTLLVSLGNRTPSSRTPGVSSLRVFFLSYRIDHVIPFHQ